jgi:signal peptidase I
LHRLKLTGNTKTILVFVLVIVAVVGGYFGLMVGLNTSVPLRVVESGSMCIPYDGACDGWLSLSHPFNATLHKGDIIFVQGVNPKELKTTYPNSDIIVYKKPNDPTAIPIVHRIVTSYEANGTLFFQTKGDGNGTPYPAVVNPIQYDSNSNIIEPDGQGVPANFVEGKVIMRIPYIGWITLILHGNSLVSPLIIVILILLVVLEFIMPLLKGRKKPEMQPIT